MKWGIVVYFSAVVIGVGVMAWQRGQLRELAVEESRLLGERGAILETEVFGPEDGGAGGSGVEVNVRGGGDGESAAGGAGGFEVSAWVSRYAEKGDEMFKDEEAALATIGELSGATPAQLGEVYAGLEELSHEGRDEIMMVVLALMAREDAERALDLAVVHDEGMDFFMAGLITPALEWWREHPDDAEAWFRRNEEAGNFDSLESNDLEDLEMMRLAGRAAADPAGFELGELGNPTKYTKLSSTLERLDSLLDTQERQIEFAERMAGLDEESASTVLHSWGEILAQRRSFREGVELAVALGDEERFDPIRFEVAAGSGGASKQERMNWYLSEAEGREREVRIYNLIGEWTKNDFNGTGIFLRDLPASPDRDRAVRAFAMTIADAEPPSAVDWAMDIGDEEMRGELLGRLYRKWAEYDRRAADGYFTDSGIDVVGACLPGE
ncbi:MAG: hypothetical protein AAF591_00930 [Verrucomicrobiota bacterium]